MLIEKVVTYHHGATNLKGYLVYDDSLANKPIVLIAHDWGGCNDFAKSKAHAIATAGYAAFAIDMFGEGKIGNNNEEKTALIQPLIKDRQFLQARILAAFDHAKQLVSHNKIAAIGYCFGGMCVLDLARSGADVKGVVSFHGLLQSADQDSKTQAKVLVLHGYDDPMAKPDAVINLANEMTKAGADWQIMMYGHTMHAFANPNAHDASFGTVYNKKADERSWQTCLQFLQEIFN